MLVLIRHGESTGNAARLLIGRLDSELTEKGWQQAFAARSLLGPVRRLISSPLRRARDTASALGLGLPVEVDARWVEMDYGSDEGRPLSEIAPRLDRPSLAGDEDSARGGETLAEVATRVTQACEDLFARPGVGAREEEADVVVVSHVSPIKAAVAWALEVDHVVALRLHLSTGSVSRIGWGRQAPILHTFNAVPPAS